MEYIISVKVKNQQWYEAAKEFKSVKEFEEWDDGKTPRYKKGVTFKFAYPVESIENIGNTSYTLKQYKDIESDEFIKTTFPEVSVINFKGEVEGSLVVSKSIIDQKIDVKKENGKHYVQCYLKDTEVYKILPNLWLSEADFEIFKNTEFTKMKTPKIEIVQTLGTLSDKKMAKKKTNGKQKSME